MGTYGWILVIIGIITLLMGILAFLNKPIEYTPKEPAWHAALKVIIGLIVIYIGIMVPM